MLQGLEFRATNFMHGDGVHIANPARDERVWCTYSITIGAWAISA